MRQASIPRRGKCAISIAAGTLLAMLLNACTVANPQSGQTTRASFAAALAQIQQGMPADQAKALLGKPDDIKTQTDPDGIHLARTREIWSYGTDHHLGLATLGSITIDQSNRVQYIAGTSGADELVTKLGEGELRRLLRVLGQADQSKIDRNFQPRYTLAAVNALQPLNKHLGVAVLKEYFKVGSTMEMSDHEGLILIMRALFEVPVAAPDGQGASVVPTPQDPFAIVHPGYFRPPMLGATWTPDNLLQFPLFPLVIVDDIPLRAGGGYSLGGQPEPAQVHLQYLERDAEWRRHPLTPSYDPLGAYAKLIALLPPDKQKEPSRRAEIARQLLSLIDTAYRPPAADDDEYIPPEKTLATFASAIQKVQALHLRWDPKSNCYMQGDGTVLPPLVVPAYQRTILEPHFAVDTACKLTIIVQRRNSKRIEVSTQLDHLKGPAAGFELSVVRLSQPDMILLDESTKPEEPAAVSKGTSPWTSIEGYEPLLPAGNSVRVEVVQGDQRYVSPPVEP